ncbi:MAG: hypothetical protein ACLPN1_14075, partial [Dissulfurispiraceae bacterium]
MKRLITAVVILIVFISSLSLSYGETVGILNGKEVPVVLLKTPTIDDSKANIVDCAILNETKATILETRDYENVPKLWIKVKILDGDCKGVTGWKSYPIWNLLKELHASVALTPAQERLCAPTMPEEELYDLQIDPHEIN